MCFRLSSWIVQFACKGVKLQLFPGYADTAAGLTQQSVETITGEGNNNNHSNNHNNNHSNNHRASPECNHLLSLVGHRPSQQGIPALQLRLCPFDLRPHPAVDTKGEVLGTCQHSEGILQRGRGGGVELLPEVQKVIMVGSKG